MTSKILKNLKLALTTGLCLQITTSPALALEKHGGEIKQVAQKAKPSEFSSADLRTLEKAIDQDIADSNFDLSAKERWLLSKIIFTMTLQGLIYSGKKIVGQLTPLSSESAHFYKDLSQDRTRRYEKNILNFFASIADRGQLPAFIRERLENIAKIPVLGEGLKKLTEEEKQKITQFAASNIYALVRTRGLTKDSASTRYVEWVDVVDSLNTIRNSGRLLKYNTFGEAKAEEIKILVDGTESFRKRQQLFENAEKSIDILVWAIQDDETGQWLIDQLRPKLKQGVSVRLIVDGQTAERPGYNKKLAELEAMGVRTIHWNDSQFKYVGQHRKMILVDEEHVISGGLNFGNEYSHIGNNVPHWRDTDVYIKGDFASNVAQKYFDNIWDERVSKEQLKVGYSPYRKFEDRRKPISSTMMKVSLIDHSPEKTISTTSNILRALLSDIQLARKSVDIENAYVILNPAVRQALEQAIQRKVKVRIFTNSIESVDEKVIGEAMMLTSRELLKKGAEIYFRKGTTVHSKFMIIDDYRSYVTSYNLHPRSERMEGEMMLRVEDVAVTKQLRRIFETDIYNAKTSYRVTNPRDLEIPMSVMLWVLTRVMYDQL